MLDAQFMSLSVYGFRRFSELRSFAPVGQDGEPLQTLVIAGPNGSGKSTFFEALLYALGREDLLHRELETTEQQRWLTTALAPDVRVSLSLQVNAAPGTVMGSFAPCRLRLERESSAWRLYVGDAVEPFHLEQATLRALTRELPVEFFSSWRHAYLPGPIRPMSPLPPHLKGEQSRLWQVKQRLIDERTRAAIRGIPGRDKDWLQRLKRGWHALRGDDGTFFLLDAVDEAEEASLFDLFLAKEDPELGLLRLCTVDQLSSGELEWLAMVGTLVIQDFQGLLLLDEPELHMHPEWQSNLLPALRSVAPRAQLLIATHADPPWDQVYSFERLLLLDEHDPRRESAS